LCAPVGGGVVGRECIENKALKMCVCVCVC